METINIETIRKSNKKFSILICCMIFVCVTIIILCKFTSILELDLFVYYFVIAILVYILIMNLFKDKALEKCYTMLKSSNEESELDKIIRYDRNHYLFTENYIIKLKFSEVLLYRYSDIVLMYKNMNMYFGKPSGLVKELYLITKKGTNLRFIIKDYSDLIISDKKEPIDSIIKEKNSSVLEGLTKENKKIIYEKYNIKI